MPRVTGTFTAHEARGIREDLQDRIFDISPTETPLLSALSRGKASNTLHEWQTDALEAATTANAHIEGDDITSFPTVTPTVRVGNYLQISRKLLIISATLEATDRAGRAREEAYQIARRGVELRRDMETIVFANIGGSPGGAATARQMATLGAWLKSNTSEGVGGADPTYTSGVPGAARTDATAGSQRAFTETLLKSAIQSAWSSGANIDNITVFAGPVNKQRASAFTGIATKNYDLSRPKPSAVIFAADVFVSDFGTVKIVPNRWMRERDVYGLDPEYASLAFLRPVKNEPLAKTGDAEKRMLIAEWTLRVHNEAAHFGVFDLTTT